MEKEIFNKWNNLKQEIDSKQKNLLFNEREICIINIGINIGNEQNGKNEDFIRPIIVFKKFNKNLFLGIPLTSKNKINKFHFEININKRRSFCVLSQIRLFDAKRIKRKIGYISHKDFNQIKDKLFNLIFFK